MPLQLLRSPKFPVLRSAPPKTLPAGLDAVIKVAWAATPRTVLQAVDSLMPGFDKEIARTAQRLLINPRRIDYHTGVLATKVTPGQDIPPTYSDPECLHP